MLAKLAWMVISGKESICMDLLRAKSKVSSDWLRTEPPKIASTTWRAIEGAKKLVEKGACYLLGDGRSMDIWAEPWVPWLEGFKPQPRVSTDTQQHLKAYELIDLPTKTWKFAMVTKLFSDESAKAILAVYIPYSPRQDKLIWVLNPKGIFSIKSVHNVSFRSPISANLQNSLWKKLWKAKLPERLRMLLRRIGAGALPTKVNLNRRFDHIDPTCILCNNAEESPIHLFFGCPFARAL